MPDSNFKTGFLKTLWILREYLSEIVIGGGWVPFLYYHYLIGDKTKESILTRDIDLIVKRDIPIIGSKTVDQLLTRAGLKTFFKSRENPPVIHYEGKIEGFDVEVEFITDQPGSSKDIVVKVQKGLHAEALRFISILIENIIEVEIDDFSIGGELSLLKVKIPSPEAYIFHKGLVFTRRKDLQKSAKDLYYIFDILVNCSRIRIQINEGIETLKEKYPSWFKSFHMNLEDYFSDVSSEGVMRIFSQRPAYSLPHLNDEQFKQYVLGKFQELIDRNLSNC